jgi:hypothetical protein
MLACPREVEAGRLCFRRVAFLGIRNFFWRKVRFLTRLRHMLSVLRWSVTVIFLVVLHFLIVLDIAWVGHIVP